jgi:hypothetical protein
MGILYSQQSMTRDQGYGGQWWQQVTPNQYYVESFHTSAIQSPNHGGTCQPSATLCPDCLRPLRPLVIGSKAVWLTVNRGCQQCLPLRNKVNLGLISPMQSNRGEKGEEVAGISRSQGDCGAQSASWGCTYSLSRAHTFSSSSHQHSIASLYSHPLDLQRCHNYGYDLRW